MLPCTGSQPALVLQELPEGQGTRAHRRQATRTRRVREGSHQTRPLLIPVTGLLVLTEPCLEDWGGSAPSPVPGPRRVGLCRPLRAARDPPESPGERWDRSCGSQAAAASTIQAGDSGHPPHSPQGQAVPPWGTPHWSRAPLARGCELHPDTCTSLFCPNECGFTVSERDAGDAPLSQAGLWEPPQDHPARSCGSPRQGRQQRAGLTSPGPAGRIMGFQAAWHKCPGQGVWNSAARLAQTGKELLILPSPLR